jgi:hypothetical protein
VPGERVYVEVDSAGGVDLFHGSFREAEATEPGFDPARLLERALRHAADRLAGGAPAGTPQAREQRLFEEHARFRRGQELAAGWYRAGEPLSHDAFVVDLDLFVELVLPVEAWKRLRGRTVAVSVLGDDFEVEIPDEAGLDEVWTLPDCGLFEPLPGGPQGDEEEPGRFGDINLVPIAF